MKFMTAASVRNLPHYMQESRLLARDQAEQEEKKRQQDERKLIADLGFKMNEIYETAKTPEEISSRTKDLLQPYKEAGTLTPEVFQMSLMLSKEFQARQDKEREEAERKTDKATDAANRNLLGRSLLMSHGQKDPQEDDYTGQVTQQALLGQLASQGGDVLGLLNYQSGLEDRKYAKERTERQDARQAEIDALNKRNIESMIAERNNPKFQGRMLYGPDGESIRVQTPEEYQDYIDAGFTPIKPASGKGGKKESSREDQIFALTKEFMKDGSLTPQEAYQQAVEVYEMNYGSTTSPVNSLLSGYQEDEPEAPVTTQASDVQVPFRRGYNPDKPTQRQARKEEPQKIGDTLIPESDVRRSIQTAKKPGVILGPQYHKTAETPLTVAQEAMSELPAYKGKAARSDFPPQKMPGEDDVAAMVRYLYPDISLQERKKIASDLKKKFPEASSEEIAQAIYRARTTDDAHQRMSR